MQWDSLHTVQECLSPSIAFLAPSSPPPPPPPPSLPAALRARRIEQLPVRFGLFCSKHCFVREFCDWLGAYGHILCAKLGGVYERCEQQVEVALQIFPRVSTRSSLRLSQRLYELARCEASFTPNTLTFPGTCLLSTMNCTHTGISAEVHPRTVQSSKRLWWHCIGPAVLCFLDCLQLK